MMAPTNAAVVALNREAQRRRLDAGQLDAAGRSMEVGPYRIHAGDLVSTRHNARQLVTDRHLMVKNRDRWTVETVHRDGSVSVAGRTGSVRLPVGSVAEHVELAYAETSHANQGRTVHRSFVYLDGPTGASGIYVPMTRGRESNEAFVAIRGEETPADVVAEALSRTWIDRPAIAVSAELHEVGSRDDADDTRSTPERPLLPRRHGTNSNATPSSSAHWPERALNPTALAIRSPLWRGSGQRSAGPSRSTKHGWTRPGAPSPLDRPFVRRRHRVQLDAARNQLDWVPRAIEGERAKLPRLDVEERHAAKRLADAVTFDANRPQLMAERAIVRYQLDQDARVRGEHRAADLPEPVLDRLGPRPTLGPVGDLWVDVVGRSAQHRVAFEQHGSKILGRGPALLLDDAYALSHRAASEAIERVDRALGREPELEIEPPHRSLGRSL